MDILKKVIFLIFLIVVSSCSTVGYIWEQSTGQISIQWQGVENEKILADESVKKVFKDKILLINELKKFFYAYFNKETTGIYSKTTILEREAVSYLVIASKKTEIDPLMHEFPIVGAFPYLGFFSEKSAVDYAHEVALDKSMSVFVRPVYAYTTLGYFEDRILSSFFYFDDLELSELIFHELFHTIFFIKNEVDFNEALAEHFARELVKIYYAKEPVKLAEFLGRKVTENKYATLVSNASRQLSLLYKNEKNISDEGATSIINEFLNHEFLPKLQNFCHENKWKPCPSEGTWNNARFAAFMTYEDKQDEISVVQQKHKFTLKEFLGYLESTYKTYDQEDIETGFFDYLKKD